MMTIDPAKYMTQLNQSMLDISAVSIVASLWTSFVFLSSGNWRKTPHSQTTVLVGAQTLISIGALVWSTLCSPYPDDGDSGEHQGLAVTLIQVWPLSQLFFLFCEKLLIHFSIVKSQQNELVTRPALISSTEFSSLECTLPVSTLPCSRC